MNQLKIAEYAPTVLRFGLAFLFLWFGISQVANPAAWTAWVPEWADAFFGAHKIVLINGWFETVGGILLAVGLWTRLVALVLSLHLFFIAYEVGWNDIGVRDFALAICALALAMFGSGAHASYASPRQNPKIGV